MIERTAPTNAFSASLQLVMREGSTAFGLTDAQWAAGIGAWHDETLAALMDAADEAPEEQWFYREEVIKALCACKHTSGHYLRRHVIAARDLHKRWPTKAWNANQFCRVSLLMTAYRDQLPREFAPREPIMDPFNPGFFHGQSPLARDIPRYAGEFLTWRGDYRPFAYHLEAA